MPYVTSIEQMAKENERRAITLKLLQKNLPLETISEVTGLTITQLQQLQAKGDR